MLQFEM